MNLIFRMLYVWFISRKLPRISMENPHSSVFLRVLPNDLDINMHVNNGRYLTLCDLNRIDFFIRSGLLTLMRKNKWLPIIAEHTMTYKRPLKLFDKFEIKLDLISYDEKYFYMQHTFIRNEKIIAQGNSKGCVWSKTEGVIPPQKIINLLELNRE